MTLKDKGYSADDAFKALQVAKTRKQVAVAAAKPKKTEFQERVGKLTEGVDKSSLKSLGGLATAAGQVASNANKYELDPEEMGVSDYVKEAALAPVNLAAGAAKGVLGGMTKGVEGALDVVGAEGLAGKISAQREKYLSPTGIVQKAGAFIPEVSRDVTTGVLKSGGDLIAGTGELGLRGLGAMGMDSASRGADKLESFREETFAPTNAAQKVGKVGGDIASYVIPGAAVANVGKLAKGASTLQKLGGLGKAMAAEGAVSGGITALREGELNSNVGWDAALGAAFPLGAKVIGKSASYFMKPKAAKDLIKEADRIDDVLTTARNADIPEADINFIAALRPANKGAATEIFEDATQGLINRRAPTPFAVAGKYLDDYVKKAEMALSEKGKALGSAKEGLKGKIINPRPVKQTVQDLMKNLGVKFDAKGTPDFSLSKIKYSGQARQLLDDVLNFSKKSKVDAMDMENLTDQIDQISGLLTTSGVKSSDAGVRALTQAKSKINQVLEEADTGFGMANREYARLRSMLDRLKFGSEVKLAKGEKEFAGDLALRRFLGNSPKKQKKAIEAVQELENSFGLKPDLDFTELAHTADIAEKATGFVNPQSAAGIVQFGKTSIGRTARNTPIIGSVMNTADFIKDGVALLRGAKTARARAEILTEMVDMLPKEVIDQQLQEAMKKMPSEGIDKLAALAVASMLGSQLEGVQSGIQEEIVTSEGE